MVNAYWPNYDAVHRNLWIWADRATPLGRHPRRHSHDAKDTDYSARGRAPVGWSVAADGV